MLRPSGRPEHRGDGRGRKVLPCGKRKEEAVHCDNVKLIREDRNGHKQFVTLNLNDADLLLSPYYQLQQNDILYVTPNKTKAQSADIGTSTTMWVSGFSILVSIASLLVNILR